MVVLHHRSLNSCAPQCRTLHRLPDPRYFHADGPRLGRIDLLDLARVRAIPLLAPRSSSMVLLLCLRSTWLVQPLYATHAQLVQPHAACDGVSVGGFDDARAPVAEASEGLARKAHRHWCVSLRL
jgi:hypothetical protein